MDKSFLKKAVAGDISEGDVGKLYELFRKNGKERDTSFRADMALRAAKLGYFSWPASLRKFVRGKRVLDVGCGKGIHALGFITFGARKYVGMDPTLKFTGDLVKNKNARLADGKRPRVPFGWTPKEIRDAFPGQISFFKGTFEEMRSQRKYKPFDVIAMHTVTEHLLNIEEVFASFPDLLAPDGVLIFMHDNFYGWKGHHMVPKRLENIDEHDPEQKKYIDWNHILYDPPEGHYFRRGLNRIRLDDLKALTEKHFTIEEWRETTDDFGRLTPEIRARLADYTERDLTTSMVFCVARNRRKAVQPELAARPAHVV